MKKKIGIVGMGKMGILHGALLRELPGIELTAVAESSPLVVRAFRSLLPSIAYFSSYEKMIAEADLDALVIATPSASHVPIALLGLDRGLDLFIEKPLSNDLASAKALQARAAKEGIVSMVGYCLRYVPTFEKAREAVRSGRIGEVREITGEMYIADVLSPQKGWRYNPAVSGGGVIIDFTVHMLDLLHWFFGRPATVRAVTKKVHSKLVEDEAVIDLTYADGKAAKVTSSWSSAEHRKSYSKMTIRGAGGTIVVTGQTLDIDAGGT
ncbi:Gfo/Idh/MocA family oxidoreductase, partial [Candidatus Parcubacteria bacterium]|nr:Gfo/Idh/MocA family oxidoreductase [Candidatus Parcubacteria bacterium]